eukprot:gene3400-6752_t
MIPNMQNNMPNQGNPGSSFVFQPPKFGPVGGQIRHSDLLNINEIFAEYYFPPDIEQPPHMQMDMNQQHSYYDGSDADFLNFLCAPELNQQSYMPHNVMAPNQQSNMVLLPMRVPPMPRSSTAPAMSMHGYDRSQMMTADDGMEYDDDYDNNSRKRKNRIDNKEMTVQQKLERRERNREHAKRSRIRKKVLLDTLQDQLLGLRTENTKLRRIVADRIPYKAQEILERCTTEESHLLSNHDKNAEHGNKDQRRILMEPDFRLIGSLITSQQNFVVSDPSLPDNPIVYCSEGFCKLTGYKRQEVLGRNCRFLQGPETDQRAVDMIRQGVTEGRDVSVCLLNYKADGSPFWNQFFVAALRGSDGNIVNYVGVQCEVNTLPVAQMKDRVKKLPLSFL